MKKWYGEDAQQPVIFGTLFKQSYTVDTLKNSEFNAKKQTCFQPYTPPDVRSTAGDHEIQKNKSKNGNGNGNGANSEWNGQVRVDSKKTISEENANFNTEFQMENSTQCGDNEVSKIENALKEFSKKMKEFKKLNSSDVFVNPLYGGVVDIQGELKLSFSDKIDDIVNDYFSAEIKKIKTKSSIISLKNLYENKCNITILPFPSKKNDWWCKLSNFSGINVVGSLSDSLNGDIAALVLSKQNIEYTEINTALYTTQINSKNITLYSNFLTSMGFTVICKKLITSKKYIILFSIQVTSEIEQKLKITSIKNFQLDKNVNPKLIGVFSKIDKEIING